jgi:Cysteine-rich CPXCG
MKSRGTDIDRLYGLEPVFEPGQEPGSNALEQFVDVSCPYCAETITVRADLSAGSQSYVEDCQVCCQPIMISVNVGATAGTEWSLTSERAS